MMVYASFFFSVLFQRMNINYSLVYVLMMIKCNAVHAVMLLIIIIMFAITITTNAWN